MSVMANRSPYDRLKPFVKLSRIPGANTYGIAPEKWKKMSARQKQRVRERVYFQRLKEDPVALAAYYAKQRQYRPNNVEARERASARKRAWKRENREKCNAYNRTYLQRKKAKRQMQKSPELVYEIVTKAIPRAFPKHVRDDVASIIYLDILESRASLENIDGLVAKALTRFNRTMETYKTRSLDAPIPGTDGLTMLDLTASQAAREG